MAARRGPVARDRGLVHVESRIFFCRAVSGATRYVGNLFEMQVFPREWRHDVA
jgi:hypothetical protein